MTTMVKILLLALAAWISVVSIARADNFTGSIDMLEVWKSGNVAFTLTTSTGTCNGQFMINGTTGDPGAKNIYAAVLAAKKTGSPVRVYTSGCGPADGYGGNYNLVLYLYVLD